MIVLLIFYTITIRKLIAEPDYYRRRDGTAFGQKYCIQTVPADAGTRHGSLDIGHRHQILDIGYWTLDTGYWLLDTRY